MMQNTENRAFVESSPLVCLKIICKCMTTISILSACDVQATHLTYYRCVGRLAMQLTSHNPQKVMVDAMFLFGYCIS
jgi:hypothetical protein